MKQYYICITPFFPTQDSFRGPFILDQVKAIARNSNYEVIVMKPSSFLHKCCDYVYDGVSVYQFVDFTLPSNIFPNNLSDRLTYHSFRNKIRELSIDPEKIAVIHAHVAQLGSTAIRLKRDYPHIKTIVQHHGFDVMSEMDGRFAKYDWHKKICQRHGTVICNEADLNVGVSKHTLEYVLSVTGIKLKDTYVLYNGVDYNKFSPSSAARNVKKEFSIGCVANFWELKDQMTLIKAVEVLINEGYTNLKVIFIGTGYTLNACKDYINSRNINQYFDFISSLPHNELPDFYRSLDLFILPSYWEAFGCVYTEAYACGVPFIGVKGQGISEIIPDATKDRWLIEKGDYSKLAELIKQTIINPNETQDLSVSINIDELIPFFLKRIKD